MSGTDPMTPSMTPREKVELKPCPFCGRRAAMQFSKFELHDGFHVVCEGDKNCPLYCSTPYRAHDTQKEAAEVWNRRTALASGSGDHADHSGGVTDMVDHAELARLADMSACVIARHGRAPSLDDLPSDPENWSGFAHAKILAKHRAALLAENAALRGEREGWVENYDRATNLHASTCRDLAEAERKLAEADRKIEDLTSALRSISEGNLGDMSWQANYETIRQVARNAISKEAERG